MIYLCGEPDGISISKAIGKVVDGKWILAPFQRPKAWKWKEQKALLESLLNGIPIGVVYIWEYDEKNSHLASREVPGISFKKDDVQALILDGQQRLSFLSWMKKSSIDSNFNQGPGLIYFNALEGEFTTRNTEEDKKNGVIIVNNLMKTGYKLEIDNALFENNKALGHANFTEITHKINTLHSALNDRKIVYQALDKRATMGDSFMIYERVNDAGKPLKGDDYAEAALFSLYPALHTEIQNAVHVLGLHPQDNSKTSFKKAFTRSNFIRSMVDELYHTHNPNSKKDYPLCLLMNFKDPKYLDFDSNKEKKLTKNKIKETFKKVEKAYIHLKEIFVDDLFMMDDEGVNSTFCIPVNTYLRNAGTKISSHEKGQFIKWFILFHIQAKPYLGSQDRKIKEDCAAAREKFPFKDLIEQLRNNAGANLMFTAKNTLIKFGRPGNKPKPQTKFLGHMQLMISIYNGATDWFEHKKLENVKRVDLHKHHIFPQKLYGKENKLTKDYIGNISRIIKRTNSSIKDKAPASKSYLPEISKRKSKALIAQQIPLTNQNLWKFSSKGLGKKFMEARVKLLGEQINSFIKRCDNDTWHQKQAEETRLSFDEMLKSSETQDLEFKESMLWMIEQNKGSKNFAFTISKEIAGFMNNGGGTLFIGVQDDEKKPDRIIGLQRDFDWIKSEFPNDNVEEKFEEIYFARVKQDLTKKNYDKIIESKFHTINGVKIFQVIVPHVGEVRIKKYKQYNYKTESFDTIKDVLFVRRKSSVQKDEYINDKGKLVITD
ncbi:MAG: hypothetical protein CMP80_00600 [Formosa sp.]|nr:hypothetical protein [Formosa sp.]|tara:strand:- start:3174 stop:5492 length:2319 start_codon:yes stop_codon:yes gene_type:complete